MEKSLEEHNEIARLRSLVQHAYMEGYRQGSMDEGRGDFAGSVDERWQMSDVLEDMRILMLQSHTA